MSKAKVKATTPIQSTKLRPDTHPLRLLDGATNPWNIIWKLAHEPLSSFVEPWCEITANGKLKPKANSGAFNRLLHRCELLDEVHEWYSLVQRELVPLIQPWVNERNSAMVERFFEKDPKRLALLSHRLQRSEAVLHEAQLKWPRLLKYMGAMALHRHTLEFRRNEHRLWLVRLEYFVSLTVQVALGEIDRNDELCDLMGVMDAATQTALRGYVSGGWFRDDSKVVRLWPSVQAQDSVLTIGTGS